MTTKQITQPVAHKLCIITPSKKGFDVINPSTGRWSHYPTQRSAKWWASVWSSAQEKFDHSTIRKVPTIEEQA